MNCFTTPWHLGAKGHIISTGACPFKLPLSSCMFLATRAFLLAMEGIFIEVPDGRPLEYRKSSFGFLGWTLRQWSNRTCQSLLFWPYNAALQCLHFQVGFSSGVSGCHLLMRTNLCMLSGCQCLRCCSFLKVIKWLNISKWSWHRGHFHPSDCFLSSALTLASFWGESSSAEEKPSVSSCALLVAKLQLMLSFCLLEEALLAAAPGWILTPLAHLESAYLSKDTHIGFRGANCWTCSWLLAKKHVNICLSSAHWSCTRFGSSTASLIRRNLFLFDPSARIFPSQFVMSIFKPKVKDWFVIMIADFQCFLQQQWEHICWCYMRQQLHAIQGDHPKLQFFAGVWGMFPMTRICSHPGAAENHPRKVGTVLNGFQDTYTQLL